MISLQELIEKAARENQYSVTIGCHIETQEWRVEILYPDKTLAVTAPFDCDLVNLVEAAIAASEAGK